MGKLTEKKVLSSSRASCLKNVRNLNCWGSDIDDISILKKLPNLEVLNLSVNHVTKLKDLAFCPKLKEIYMRKNDLADLNEIASLKKLPCLKVLWLSENLCTADENYRYTVIRNLPHLQKLDNCDVDEEERNISHLEGEEFSNCSDLPDYSKLDLSVTLQEEDLSNLVSTGEIVHDVDCEELKEIEDSQCASPRSIRPDWEDHKNKNVSVKVDKKSIRLSHSPDKNILSAALLLLNELGAEDLRTIIEEAESRLSELENDEAMEEILEL